MAERDSQYELLQQAVDGDRAALSQILLIHHDAIHRHISIEMASQSAGIMLVDDVLQQTFVRAAQAIGKFDLDRASLFRAWLKTIASNLIKDAVKRRRRERRGALTRLSPTDDESFSQAIDRLSGDLTPPITRVQRSESVRRMRTAVASLPDEQREIVEQYYLQACSLEEIAAATGRTIGAVRGICYRARKSLRKLMGGSSLYFSN